MSAVSMPTPTTRARCRTMAWRPVSASCSNRSCRASSISLICLVTKPSRAISRCNSAETFGGSAEPSGVCSVARRSAAPRLRGGRPAQGWFEVANAQPGQGALHSVDDARALPDQALALPVGPLGVLFGNGRDARHGAVAPFPAQPPQEPPLHQLGVEPVGLGPAMFPRYGDTRGMDHMRLHPTRPQPARQPEAIAAGFEGQRNPGDLAAGLDRLVAPAMQQAKQPFCTRLQLLAWLALNAGKHTGNQPTRLAHLDDGNDRAILVQGDEGPAQVVRLGHQGTPSVGYSDDGAISSPPAPYHLSAGGSRIRTFGPASGTRRLGTASCSLGDPSPVPFCRNGIAFRDRGTAGSNPAPSSRESVSRPHPLSKVQNPGFPRGCARLAWRPGRQRRSACFDSAPTCGNISVGPYSSTAAPVTVVGENAQAGPNEVGPSRISGAGRS